MTGPVPGQTGTRYQVRQVPGPGQTRTKQGQTGSNKGQTGINKGQTGSYRVMAEQGRTGVIQGHGSTWPNRDKQGQTVPDRVNTGPDC